jgi:bifunctional non-homologous end joining protein LigD
VIWLNGADLRPLPLTERRRHLQSILPKGSAIISGPLSVTGSGHKLFELMCAHDLEGIVAKRLKDRVRLARPVAEDQEPKLLAE